MERDLDVMCAVGWLVCPPLGPVPVGREGCILAGRAPSCDLVLHHESVSRLHCELRADGRQLVFRDCGSAGGTWLNGARLEQGRLRYGDRLGVGHFEIEYVASCEQVSGEGRLEDSSVSTTVVSTLNPAHDLASEPLAELVQGLEFNARSVVVRVLAAGRRGRIVVREGIPLYASFGDLRGVEALLAMLPLSAGRVTLAYDEQAPPTLEPNLRQSFTGLLLEAGRRLDESGELEARGEASARTAKLELELPQGGPASPPHDRRRETRPVAAPPQAAAPADHAGDYVLERLLGVGSMGRVYQARHRITGAPYAVKTLRAAEPDDLARFLREAEAQARVDAHPHVLRVHSSFCVEERRFLVTELAAGGSLENLLLEQGPLPWEQAVGLVRDLAQGLAYLHRHGVVHRDLKPANVLFAGDGRAKLADFGLAHLRGAAALTLSGDVLGTPLYMAPEQALGRRALVGPASDVYALGVILYELLAGETPFLGATPAEVVQRSASLPPPPLSRRRRDLPAGLPAVCLAALEKDPARRPTAAELAERLEGVLRGEGGRVTPSLLVVSACFLVGLLAFPVVLGGAWAATPVRERATPARRADLARPDAAVARVPAPAEDRVRDPRPDPVLVWPSGEGRRLELSLRLRTRGSRFGEPTSEVSLYQRLALDCAASPSGDALAVRARVVRLVLQWRYHGPAQADAQLDFDSLDAPADAPLQRALGQVISLALEPQSGRVLRLEGASAVSARILAGAGDDPAERIRRQVPLLANARLQELLEALLHLGEPHAVGPRWSLPRPELDPLGARERSGSAAGGLRLPPPLKVDAAFRRERDELRWTGAREQKAPVYLYEARAARPEGSAPARTRMGLIPLPDASSPRYEVSTRSSRRLSGSARFAGAGGIRRAALSEDTVLVRRGRALSTGVRDWEARTTSSLELELELRAP